MRYVITYLNITKKKCYRYVIVILNIDEDIHTKIGVASIEEKMRENRV